MIPVTVGNIVLSRDRGFVILLKSNEDERSLPVFVDQLQAQSIVIGLSGEQLARPLTHDLFASTLKELGCELVRVEVCDLVDDTFYGKLILKVGDAHHEIDSRPSDAIALAIRTDTAIYVATEVMDQASVVIREEDIAEAENADEDEQEAVQEDLSPMDRLKRDLDTAIDQERYEDAARIRDEIRKLTSSN